MHVFCVLYPNVLYGVPPLVDEHSTFFFVVGITFGADFGRLELLVCYSLREWIVSFRVSSHI